MVLHQPRLLQVIQIKHVKRYFMRVILLACWIDIKSNLPKIKGHWIQYSLGSCSAGQLEGHYWMICQFPLLLESINLGSFIDKLAI